MSDVRALTVDVRPRISHCAISTLAKLLFYLEKKCMYLQKQDSEGTAVMASNAVIIMFANNYLIIQTSLQLPF